MARNANNTHFSHILKHSCSFHVKTRCPHVQRCCSVLEDVAFTPCFFPWLGGWQNCIYTFNFERERDYPIPQRGNSRQPTGGMVLGKSHFDFSMLVFSADFPPDTRSRRKRPKTADAAEVTHLCRKVKKKGGFPRPKVNFHHL